MRKILALFTLLLCVVSAQAATIYACSCGVGANGACVAGSQTAPYDTPAKAINTIAQFKTSFQSMAAGDQLLTCQGGAFDGVATGNMLNTNCTAAAPCVIGSYDDTARWVGGAGIRPKFNNTSAAAALSFAKGTFQHTEGYTIQDIEIVGDGVNTTAGILIVGDSDYVTIDNVVISGGTNGIQCEGGPTTAATNGDSHSQHFIVRNSTIQDNRDNGILVGCSDALIEGNTFDQNGNTNQDHHIYVQGARQVLTAKTIASITGDGVTATLTTTTPHLLPDSNAHFTIGVSGSTSSGSGSFNVTGGYGGTVATITGPTTITYPATGTPSASVVGTYTATRDLPLSQVAIRNNTLTNASTGALGTCVEAAIVIHGDWQSILVEGNTVREDTVGTNTGCIGIEITSGAYSPPEDYERFNGVVVRNNTVVNYATGISVDIERRALVENNYVYSTFATTEVFGIRHRGKNFAPTTVGSSTIDSNDQQPDNVTLRYNTVYLTAPSASSWAMVMNGNSGDALTGKRYNLYGNLIVLGSTATTATKCLDTQNMTVAMFDVKDYNSCIYLGASAPKWENTSTLATIQASGDLDRSDLNSTFAQSCGTPPCDPTVDQPVFTAPTTSPAIATGSNAKNTGHPNLGPSVSWGGSLRNQGVRDKGAYEFGASSTTPNPPTRIAVQ